MSTAHDDQWRDDATRLNVLGRDLAAATLMFHAHVAAKLGLSINDHKCLDLVNRGLGRLTPSELAASAGLPTGTVTAVIDRLERAGYVERVRDTHDRRKVFVRPAADDRVQEVFSGLSHRVEEAAKRFDHEQITIIEAYVLEMIDALRDETAKLRQGGRSGL